MQSDERAGMFSYFYPKSFAGSAYSIDYRALYERGFRALIFDIDNTLVPHNAPPDERSIQLMRSLKKLGFRVMTVSNNHEPRVKGLAERLDIGYICDAHKPAPEGYRRACRIMGTEPAETACIGDQLFTDVLGANRAGIFSILVEPVDRSTDIFRIRVKRKLEKPILREFLRKKGKNQFNFSEKHPHAQK